jgi:hypothetical protein
MDVIERIEAWLLNSEYLEQKEICRHFWDLISFFSHNN